jgi:hypothetical protein
MECYLFFENLPDTKKLAKVSLTGKTSKNPFIYI